MRMAAQCLHPIVWYTSPIHSRHPKINASTQIGSAAMRFLSLNRISSANIIALVVSFRASKFVPVHSQRHMAANNNLPPQSTAEDINKKQAEHEETKSPPPPPEKPEPGDCCGSGCVRCVWDVYYEELEAYNKMYKSDSNFADSKRC